MDDFFIQVFGEPRFSDHSDSGKFSQSSRLDQSDSTLSMGSPRRGSSGYSTDRFPGVEDDLLDDHPLADDDEAVDHPDDDVPLDGLVAPIGEIQNQREQFEFWANRGVFDPQPPVEEVEVIEEVPAANDDVVQVDDPRFPLQNPIVQAMIIADLGHLVPPEHIVQGMEEEPMEVDS